MMALFRSHFGTLSQKDNDEARKLFGLVEGGAGSNLSGASN